jgi:mRNA interferase MazF
MTTTNPTRRKVERVDVFLMPVMFVLGAGVKKRPVVVVQNDDLNRRLESTVVAIITSTTKRTAVERTQLLIEVATPDGKSSGLAHDSTVKCEHLDTVAQEDIVRRLGRLSPALMSKLEECLKAALDIS